MMPLPPVESLLLASSAVTNIVGKRIFRTQADEKAVQPYLVWSIVSAIPSNNLSDLPEDDNSRIQIDCYAKDQGTCRRLRDAAMAAIEPEAYVVFGPVETREDETIDRLWRWIMDASFFTNR